MDSKSKSLTSFSNSELSPRQTKALMNYMPEQFLPRMKTILTIRQVLENNTSSLTVIKKELGSIRTEALIKIYLIRLNELLDLKKPLSEKAINEIASILVTEYYYLSMTDIVFVTQQAIRGRYGELFESLSIPKVIRWFDAYFDERCNTAEAMSIEEKNSHNSLFGRERSSDKPDALRAFSREYAIRNKIENYKNRSK